jgi:serine protease Do
VTRAGLNKSLAILATFALVGCQTCAINRPISADNQADPTAVKPLESSDARSNAQPDVQQAANSTEVLVQEPKLRSNKKPDFSSGFKQSKNRGNFFMLQAFNEAIGSAYKCTVQLMANGEQCALGTIVDTEGLIVTKASELGNHTKIQCVLSDEREFSATIVGTDAEMDIALLSIPTSDLIKVEWEFSVPEQGRWLATTDTQSSVPTAIGVVSAGPIRIPNQKAVLGVVLDNQQDGNGALVTRVLMGSGAHEAGLREQDSILEVDGTKVSSSGHLLSLLRNGKGGQYLNMMVSRDESTLEKNVRLMDLSTEMLDETEMEVNGPISARSTGFGRVFMHDTVLLPNQCGGPLVNLDGKAVGINIARAGRVSTYALPADILTPVIKRLMQQAKLVSKNQ